MLAPKFVIVAFLCDKIGVVSTFDDAPVLEDDDLIGAVDGGESVCDNEDGAIAGEGIECLLDESFGDGIDT